MLARSIGRRRYLGKIDPNKKTSLTLHSPPARAISPHTKKEKTMPEKKSSYVKMDA